MRRWSVPYFGGSSILCVGGQCLVVPAILALGLIINMGRRVLSKLCPASRGSEISTFTCECRNLGLRFSGFERSHFPPTNERLLCCQSRCLAAIPIVSHGGVLVFLLQSEGRGVSQSVSPFCGRRRACHDIFAPRLSSVFLAKEKEAKAPSQGALEREKNTIEILRAVFPRPDLQGKHSASILPSSLAIKTRKRDHSEQAPLRFFNSSLLPPLLLPPLCVPALSPHSSLLPALPFLTPPPPC